MEKVEPKKIEKGSRKDLGALLLCFFFYHAIFEAQRRTSILANDEDGRLKPIRLQSSIVNCTFLLLLFCLVYGSPPES
jgi:hypothetical protein